MSGEPTSGLVVASLDRLVAAAARQRAAIAAILGVTPSDVLALQHVARAGELTPTALSARMRLSSSGTTAVINRLTKAGLVSRGADPTNGRRVLLRATPHAATLAGGLLRALLADIDALVRELPGTERASIERFLGRLADLGERNADRTVTEAEAAARAAVDVPTPALWG